MVYTKDKATTLQRTLDDIPVNLYQQFDCNTATSKWNLAKKSTHGLTRELRLRYRNKIKGIIPVNPPRNETIAETTMKQKRPSFIKDTTQLLQKISELNDTGPFPDGTLLVSWDVVAMFPNIDNDLGLLAVTQALNSRPNQFPSTECIVEAVKIFLAT